MAYFSGVQFLISQYPVSVSHLDRLLTTLDRAILHVPFVPFNILFTRAVQLLDVADLARLDQFAASLQPEATSPGSATHPYRLYKLLCQAARLYVDSKIPSLPEDPTLTHNLPNSLDEFDFADFEIRTEAAANETLQAGDPQTYGLSDWYYSNQQMMSLLDDDVMF